MMYICLEWSFTEILDLGFLFRLQTAIYINFKNLADLDKPIGVILIYNIDLTADWIFILSSFEQFYLTFYVRWPWVIWF